MNMGVERQKIANYLDRNELYIHLPTFFKILRLSQYYKS